MIQDDMIREVQELKLMGCTPKEVHEELRKRHTKVSTLKTVREYYNMDCVPDDDHARVRKQMASDCELFVSAIVELNPDCYMSSVHDVLLGNEQTLRNYIHRLVGTARSGGPARTGASTTWCRRPRRERRRKPILARRGARAA